MIIRSESLARTRQRRSRVAAAIGRDAQSFFARHAPQRSLITAARRRHTSLPIRMLTASNTGEAYEIGRQPRGLERSCNRLKHSGATRTASSSPM